MDALGVIHFTDTITIGSVIVGILVGLPAVFVIFRGAQWRALAQAAEETAAIYKEGREAYRTRADRMEEELKASLVMIGEQKEIIGKLEALPNLATLQAEMATLAATATQTMLDALEHHEQRAEARHERLAEEHAATQARMQDTGAKLVGLVDVIGLSLAELHKDIVNGRTT